MNQQSMIHWWSPKKRMSLSFLLTLTLLINSHCVVRQEKQLTIRIVWLWSRQSTCLKLIINLFSLYKNKHTKEKEKIRNTPRITLYLYCQADACSIKIIVCIYIYTLFLSCLFTSVFTHIIRIIKCLNKYLTA